MTLRRNWLIAVVISAVIGFTAVASVVGHSGTSNPVADPCPGCIHLHARTIVAQ